MEPTLPLADTIADLVATLRNSESQLQTRLRSCDHPGLSVWSRKLLAHALQSSERVTSVVSLTATNLGIEEDSGRVTYSIEPFLRRIELQPVSAPASGGSQGSGDLASAAALLRCTKLRVADLALLRLALAVKGNQTARQNINQLLEDAYLSAERLREFAVQPLHVGTPAAVEAPAAMCRTCRFWAGNSDADDPSKAPCMHPELAGVRLQVSAWSDCGRYEGMGMVAE